MSNPDLPFVAEYAKSNRASCKSCKGNIGKDSLRVGIMVQSAHFDGKIPVWHHLSCFFKKSKIAKVADVANFDNLRWEDQNKIKEHIASGGSKAKGGKGNSEFSVEYAKSNRSTCRTCSEKIQKGEVRISKLIYDNPTYGPQPGWRHVDCFVKDRLELDYLESAANLPGFKSLAEEDQKTLLEKIEKLNLKRKTGETNGVTKKLRKEDELMKVQNTLLFEMRDKLKIMSKKEMVELLEYNKQHISPGEHNNRDNLSDCLVFGAIKTCPECKKSSPRYKIDAYRCSGNVTEWTKCQYVTRCPEREPFKIPEEFKEKYEFLKEYTYVKRERILPEKESKPAPTKGPLNGFIIAAFGKFSVAKKAIEQQILDLGGAVSQKVDKSVKCCVSTQAEIDKESKNVITAKNLDIHIVSEKFLNDLKNGSAPAVSAKENLISSWGGDPILKFGIKQENAKSQVVNASTSSSSSKKSGSSGVQKIKVSLKGGAAVDPESGKEDTCEVYQNKDDVYNCVLGMVDLSRGANTYYKLQLLVDERKKPVYYLFRAWGRVGTKIGDSKLGKYQKLDEAINEFKRLYLDKTGNHWADRKNFVKHPKCFYPLDIDYGQEANEHQELKPSENCKLPKSVQELVCLIFDIEAMKKAMVEFEIDLKKMPLGKLSKKQIEQAYSVLNEAQEIIVTGCNAVMVLDASNRFYTLIPHDFGLKTPPLLDNEELIKSKIEMLDSLLEIEFAYSLMKGESGSKDNITEHYEKLQTDIDVLEKDSEEYKIINKYMKNTHADTHNQYSLVLNKVFKINRHGESERFSKFKNLHNKKLLWHGSRLTNYVGILSQGLRIAPPEAPVTGYMFGKGIYFADMVSKSANYCATSKKSPTGLMLLCEVALGNMYERTHSEYVQKLPHDTHSTKGLGMTIPNPKETTKIGDVEVPYGKPVQSNVAHSALLYNEYIVYDVSQVNIKYLLEVSFKWKY